ncbi:hypothetical protein A6E15_18185 [Natrinema saccharevitans]|uniref:Uncharacterized protein n=1 Tax=Natrinema saccharevitans TaxID=301967 RepID=A0A1S8AR88_9EURY|nr:hypothetical protein [Natrinema saccharevitans]OLZ39323.1 hypothetical protein A6E15_18185 [Natrinema saccharevitans]
MTAFSGLSRVRMLGRVAIGFSIGGFVTVLAGFVVPSLQTTALAGLASFGLLYHGVRKLMDSSRSRSDSFGTVGGVAVTAIVVTVLNPVSLFPEASSSVLGTGVFLTGFLLCIAV